MPLHQYTPGVKVPSGLEPVNPIPVDSWSGPYAAGSTTAAVASANSTIPASLRFLSLEVRILAPDPDNAGQTLAYKYWYRGSTADSGLVEFSAGTNITDYVTSFNGLTGAVQGVSAAVAGTGIFVNAATGAVTITNTGVQSFNGNTGAIQGVSSWNGQTGAVSFVDYVSSFNGLTGAVNGVTVGGVNTFTQLNTFNSGITTAFIYASTGSTFAGTLRVNGGTTLAARVDIGGVLDVVGGTTLESTLDVGGVARFAAGITTTTLDASQAIRANGGLTASTFDVTGTSRFAQGVTLSGRVDVGGVLDVVSGTTLESTLDVAGVARFASGVTFSALSTFTNGITASYLYASTGSTFGSTIQVSGGATLAGRVDIGGVLDVVGGTTLESTLDVAGVARFASGVTFSALSRFTNGITTSYLYASTGSTFGGTLQVVGGSTLAGRVDVGGVLDVVGGTTLESTLDVSGAARFNGGSTASALDVSGVARFAGGSTFSGAARFAAGITTTTLDATGVVRASAGLTASTLDVTSTSRFAGGATFSSSADFAGAARFAVGLTSSGDVVVGSAGTVFKTNGDATIGATLNVNGNFYVTGTITTVNQTNLSIDDKYITLGRTLDSDALADGGGLILNSATDRTLTWDLTSDAWTSSVNYRVLGSNGYKIDNTTVLASGMIHGLSASAGSISGGTWAANIIGLAYGGSNKNLVSVGASGGVVFKDGTGLSITSAGSNGQILQANASGAPTWVNLTTLTGLTADSVKITDRHTTAGTMYLTFTTDAGAAMSLFIDKSSGVTYDASTNTLSCTKLEATVDGGVF